MGSVLLVNLNLMNALNEQNFQTAIEIIEGLSTKQVKAEETYLIDVLMTTCDGNLRNSIALRLSDIRSEALVGAVTQLVEDPKTIGNRGTLLYALQDLDYSGKLDALLPLLGSSSFEVSREAFNLIEPYLHSLSPDQQKTLQVLLNQQIENLQEELSFKQEILHALTSKG